MNDNRPHKHFGQHFLHDRNILDKIMAAVRPEPGQHFVEIGPGRGAMTGRLIENSEVLHAIEIDRDLAAALPATIASNKLKVYQMDALKFDFERLRPDNAPLRLVGNLPYNISTPLLFHLLEYSELFSDLHVMLQKEVARRIAAEPGNKIYGRLTVAVAARCDIDALFDIRPGSFTPQPRVDSSFIRLRPNAARRARIERPDAFDLIVKLAFGQRRKRLSNALGGLLTAANIESAGIEPGVRAEQLSVDDFIALANLPDAP